MLRREEDGEDEESSFEEVVVRLEGWRDGQRRDCGVTLKRGELVWGLSRAEVWVSSLFSRFGGEKLKDRLRPSPGGTVGSATVFMSQKDE